MRPARPDEQPKFGQAWRWGDSGPPLMCVAPVDGVGLPAWRFLDLDDAADIRTWYWCDTDGRPFDDWLLLDE